MSRRVLAEDLKPNDMVRFDGRGRWSHYYTEGDEIVDRVSNELSSTFIWWVGWSEPVEHRPDDIFEVIN